MILSLLSYVGIVIGFFLLVLAIALGLFYLSELVEEHTEPTKRLLKRTIYLIVAVFVLLWLTDSFPFLPVMFLIFSYFVYLQNLAKFPYVELTSPIFLLSCVLVVVNHFLWFNHFLNPPMPLLQDRLRRGYVPPLTPLLSEVLSFFGLCVWFVPFALFVSLSSHDNLLPQHMENPDARHRSAGLAKAMVGSARDKIYLFSRRLGYELDPNYGSLG